MNHRKRITYRPNKAGSLLGGVVGVIFVLIGVFVVIPSAGIFGVLWTLIAVGITVANLYQALGKTYIGPEIYVEEDTPGTAPAVGSVTDAQARLEQLQRLQDAGLVTKEEYDNKRQEILRGL